MKLWYRNDEQIWTDFIQLSNLHNNASTFNKIKCFSATKIEHKYFWNITTFLKLFVFNSINCIKGYFVHKYIKYK